MDMKKELALERSSSEIFTTLKGRSVASASSISSNFDIGGKATKLGT